MQKLADISVFEGLQNQANGSMSQMSVFNADGALFEELKKRLKTTGRSIYFGNNSIGWSISNDMVINVTPNKSDNVLWDMRAVSTASNGPNEVLWEYSGLTLDEVVKKATVAGR